MTFSISRNLHEWPLTSSVGSYVGGWVPSLFGDECVQIVPQEVSTVHASVAVENSEVGRLFPITYVLWFCEIEDYGDPILVVLTNWALVGRSGVCSDRPMGIFGVLGGLEVGDGLQSFGQSRMHILIHFDASLLEIYDPGLNENLLTDDLIDLFGGGFGFRTRLVLIAVLNRRSSAELKFFVRCVGLLFFVVFFRVKERSAVLVVLGRRGFGEFDFGRRFSVFEGKPASQA